MNATEGAPLSNPASEHRNEFWQGVVIALISVLLVSGCWRSGFTTYDDSMHVSQNEQITRMGPLELFKPIPVSTYFPITLLSYQLDRVIFHKWLGLEKWAVGVRSMSLLYHAAAALILWRVLLLLGIGRLYAFFIAVVFAVHPLATETVCWTSERKNALTGMFGFAALWAWLRFGGVREGDGAGAARAKIWRMPLVFLFFLLALFSKPSALGLLPIFLMLEIFAGVTPLEWHAPISWLRRNALGVVLRMLPLCVLSVVVLRLNLSGHAETLIAPPGGTVFTALLTDLEIVSRYLFNLLAPVKLSAVYFVDPVASVSDSRVFIYGALLPAVAAGTIFLAANRRMAVFAWLWFFAALGPSLNLIAIPHFMQDRYIYLSTPAFFIIVCEVIEGIYRRAGALTPVTVRIAAGVYVAALAALTISRSPAWDSGLSIFSDAVEKQPLAAYARFGLGMSFGQAAESASRDPARRGEVQSFRNEWMRHWREALDTCPDVKRFAFYSLLALNVGEHLQASGDLQTAEKYWKLAAYPPPESPPQVPVRALALGWLASLYLAQNKIVESHEKAEEAIALIPGESTILQHAKSSLALSELKQREGKDEEAARLRREAVEDLNWFVPGAKNYAVAQELLKNLNTRN